MVAVSNIIYFVDFAGLLRKLPASYLEMHPYLNIPNQSLQRDIIEMVEIKFAKEYSGFKDQPCDWREYVVFYCQIIPAICLAIDLIMNKIKISLRHFWLSLFINILYLGSTMVA